MLFGQFRIGQGFGYYQKATPAFGDGMCNKQVFAFKIKMGKTSLQSEFQVFQDLLSNFGKADLFLFKNTDIQGGTKILPSCYSHKDKQIFLASDFFTAIWIDLSNLPAERFIKLFVKLLPKMFVLGRRRLTKSTALYEKDLPIVIYRFIRRRAIRELVCRLAPGRNYRLASLFLLKIVTQADMAQEFRIF